MQYSRLSRYTSPEVESRTADIITWTVRTLLGAVFIFSGFVKGIDPWGTMYKFDDYLSAMGLPAWHSPVIVAVFSLCAVEFMTGVFLLLGCFRRTSAIASLVIMAFMLPLSLWIAVFDPVADCGCFGDAVVISNWATFWKNILLTIAAIWMVAFSRRAGCLVMPALQWLAFIISALFIITIQTIGYISQPLIDFRPYKTGTAIVPEDAESDDGLIFIYEKNGVKKEFTTDNLPDEEEGWTFVDRKEKSGNTADDKISGFRLWEGDTDVTEEVLRQNGGQLLLLMPDLKDVSIATTWKINSLHTWSQRHNIDMIAAVAGNSQDIANWEDLSIPEYEIYTADDTSIKEVARGNPAVVYTENGTIRWKRALRAIDVDDFMSPEISDDPMSFATDNYGILRNLIYLYLIMTAVLIAISFMPRVHRYIVKPKKTSADSKKPDEDQTDSE